MAVGIFASFLCDSGDPAPSRTVELDQSIKNFWTPVFSW